MFFPLGRPARVFRSAWGHRSPWLRVPFRCGTLLGCLGALGLIPVVALQDMLVYHPRPYGDAFLPGVAPYALAHPYIAADGRRNWGLLIEPMPLAADSPTTGGAKVPRFYLCFGGNASTAGQEFRTFEALAEATGCGFFLADYRGYGFNGGEPSEEGLTADGLGAYDTMFAEGRLKDGVGIIGHSMGGAVSFAVTEKRKVDRLLVFATFTSIPDMAGTLGLGALAPLSWNRWPSKRRLAEIVSRPIHLRPREIHIFHGRNDRIVPFSQGEELAALDNKGYLKFYAYDIGNHANIRHCAWEDMIRIVNTPLPALNREAWRLQWRKAAAGSP